MIKRIITVALLLILSMSLVSCADNKTINGVTYRPYGFLNEGSCKNDSVYYEVSGWAAFSGVAFSEIFFIPTIYTFGYNLWEPKMSISDHRENKHSGEL